VDLRVFLDSTKKPQISAKRRRSSALHKKPPEDSGGTGPYEFSKPAISDKPGGMGRDAEVLVKGMQAPSGEGGVWTDHDSSLFQVLR
jgi:hypothetical protein